MDFSLKYPTLYNFLAGYFPDADFDDLTDEDVVNNYKADANSQELQKVLLELDSLIASPNEWSTAADEANRFFEKDIEILAWLNLLKHELFS